MDLVALPYAYFASLYRIAREPRLFQEVHTYVMFIGYPRSGHTLVGFLLDAHPNAIVASQISGLRYLKHGFSIPQTFSVLVDNSRHVARVGREGRPYSYDVPNQWQGRFKKLRVIGDCTGFTRLRRDPDLLRKLREKLGAIDLKLIHVIRNPYDNISTMKIRSGETLLASVRRYFSMCEMVERFKKHVAPDTVYELKHESLIADARGALRGLCAFVRLGAAENYVDDCASLVYKSPHKSRHEVVWTPELIENVEKQMSRFAHLGGYSYQD